MPGRIKRPSVGSQGRRPNVGIGGFIGGGASPELTDEAKAFTSAPRGEPVGDSTTIVDNGEGMDRINMPNRGVATDRVQPPQQLYKSPGFFSRYFLNPQGARAANAGNMQWQQQLAGNQLQTGSARELYDYEQNQKNKQTELERLNEIRVAEDNATNHLIAKGVPADQAAKQARDYVYSTGLMPIKNTGATRAENEAGMSSVAFKQASANASQAATLRPFTTAAQQANLGYQRNRDESLQRRLPSEEDAAIAQNQYGAAKGIVDADLLPSQYKFGIEDNENKYQTAVADRANIAPRARLVGEQVNAEEQVLPSKVSGEIYKNTQHPLPVHIKKMLNVQPAPGGFRSDSYNNPGYVPQFGSMDMDTNSGEVYTDPGTGAIIRKPGDTARGQISRMQVNPATARVSGEAVEPMPEYTPEESQTDPRFELFDYEPKSRKVKRYFAPR